jgi:hypothetical protein
MADVNSNININVTGNAEEQIGKVSNKLDGLQSGQTRVTQSTKNLASSTNKLNDGLLKNGGAMGILGAATGGLAMDFKDAIEAIELTGVSLKGLRGAIIATGIGALAIVLLELITNWDKWVGVIDGSTAAMERLDRQTKQYEITQKQFIQAQAEGILNQQENIRLRTAEGASIEELNKLENELSATLARSADIALYGTETTAGLFTIRQSIAIQLRDLAEGSEKYNEVLQLQIENEDKIIAQVAIKKKALNDPAVRAAEETTAANAKKVADELERQKKATEELKRVRAEIVTLFTNLNKDIDNLKSVNAELRGITTVNLTDSYSGWKRLTDAYYATGDALKSAFENIDKLEKRTKALNKAEKEQLKDLERQTSLYTENAKLVNELIVSYKTFLESKEDNFSQTKKEEMAIDALKLQYDMLSNSISNLERQDFNPFGNVEGSERALRNLELYNLGLQIIERDAANRTSPLLLSQGQIDKEKAILEKRNAEILKNNADLIKNAEQLKASGVPLIAGSEGLQPLTEADVAITKQYFDNIDKINNYRTQSGEKQLEIDKSNSDRRLEIERFTTDALVQMELDGLAAKTSAQEEYFNNVQTLQANVYSFLDQLQNEQIIKSKDLRNVLLVAQKGAEIAQVVIATARQNSILKQQAGEYSGNAVLYSALSGSLAATGNAAGAAGAAAAATAYGTGAAKSIAQIPLNWATAGVSIASILATTLTSWNKSSGGGGSNGGGAGGAGAAAQFNIIGSSGQNQLAASIGASQNQPVNAYVVGSDMTTQQALDRNRVTNATFL